MKRGIIIVLVIILALGGIAYVLTIIKRRMKQKLLSLPRVVEL